MKLIEAGTAGHGFRFVLSQKILPENFEIQILADQRAQTGIIGCFQSCGDNIYVTVKTPVDMIRFQGPHFGDRYGIFNAAIQALNRAGIRSLACGCSGASLYFVLENECSGRAAAALSGPFEVPARSSVTDKKCRGQSEG